jgi:AcrR family transcriptional regulator
VVRKVNQVSGLGKSQKRPGGRTADVTARVHKAITELILEGGFEACTFSAVAERAGIERSTLYRRFPDRFDAIIDTWMTRAQIDVIPDPGGSFAADLMSVLRKVVDMLESPTGPALLKIAAELKSRTVDDPRAYFDARMSQLAPMFEAAIARGELAAEVDREVLFSFAAGPIYFRSFIAGRKIDDDFLHSIVSNVCWLYCSPSAAAKLSLPARMA